METTGTVDKKFSRLVYSYSAHQQCKYHYLLSVRQHQNLWRDHNNQRTIAESDRPLYT